MRSWRSSGSGRSFRHRAGWLARLILIALAVAIVLAAISAYWHARH